MEKIIRFDKFCPVCENWKVDDISGKDPCNECLNVGGREDSKKPINFKGKLPPEEEVYDNN